MKRFFSFFLCATLASCALAPALTGCKSSPQLIAYQSADAVISSVDLAMRGWADYVVSERKRIKALPAVDRGSMSAELLRKEGKVATAHGRYVLACEASEAAVGLAFNNRSSLPQNVADAASAVVAIVKEMQR